MGDQVLDYSKNEPPEGYVCSVCGATRVKLWRQSQIFIDDLELMCARCASLKGGSDISTIDKDGMQNKVFGRTDQIGSLVPAVPKEDGGSYWAYTSVPQEGVKWWVQLPTLSSPNRRNDI